MDAKEFLAFAGAVAVGFIVGSLISAQIDKAMAKKA